MTDSELAEIRRDLRQMRWYIEGPELRARVRSWIEESTDAGDADTAEQYLESQLNSMLAEYDMYHAPKLNRGEEGFPSACEDCRHFGSSCPVLLDEVEVRWRDRMLDQAETEQEARRVYQQQAIDVGCVRIPDLLDTWDNRHSEFIRRGQELVSEVEDALQEGLEEPAVGDADAELEEALADGGTEGDS